MTNRAPVLRIALTLSGCALLGACAHPDASGSLPVASAVPSELPGDCRYFDAHAHLVSSDLVRYPRNPVKPPPIAADWPMGPGRVGIPGGRHGPQPVNLKPSAEQMIQWMADEGVCGIAAVQKGMLYRTDNSYIVDAATAYPDHMRAVAIVDPQMPDALILIRDLARRGVRGIRFFGLGIKNQATWLSSPRAMEAWELVSDLELVVEIEAPMSGGERLIPVIETMAGKYPRMPIVLDHVLMPDLREPDFGLASEYAKLALYNNVHVKFTSLNMDVARELGYAPDAFLRRVVDVFGANRVMWGSDIGTSSGTYPEMVARALAATVGLDENERQKVLRDTGQRIFGP